MAKKPNEEFGGLTFVNHTGFPLESLIQVDGFARIKILLRRTDDLEVMPPAPMQQIGKLTGVQLRGLAALDQLEAMMQDELADIIRKLASCDEKMLTEFITHVFAEGYFDQRESNGFLKTIKAMALFCYRELIDRGMLPPHSPGNSSPTNQEHTDDSDDGN